jgi:hypothetical protein
MTDIVITVARDKWADFLAEHGPGTTRGRLHVFHLFGDRPPVASGDTLYVISHGRLRCALMVDLIVPQSGGWQIVAGFLRPVTKPGFIQGYAGWKRCWWTKLDEAPFADWRSEAVSQRTHALPDLVLPDLAHGKTMSEQGGSSA